MRSIAIRLAAILFFVPFVFGQTQINIDTQSKGSRPSYWGTDSGTANAYVVATVAPAGPTLRSGSRYYFVVGHTNTGASTLTVDGINHSVKKNISTALSSGDWTAGQVVEVVFDGTNFQWISLGTLTALGSVSCSQMPALTGDVTSSAGSCATTLANIPDLVPQAGSVLATNIAAPSTPASGKTKFFADSTDKRFHDKNDAGTIGTTVVADTGASNNFLTAISAAGVISKARPTCSNLSDSVASCSTDATNASNISSGTLAVARGGTGTGSTLTGLVRGNASAMTAAELSGDATTSGSNAVTVAKVNGVAYSASPSTDTVSIITASNTATYKSVPDCQDTSGNHLNYTASTHSISCGTSGSGGGTPALVGPLESHTASSSASLDFTSCISGTYDNYMIVISQLLPATDSVDIKIQLSTNGGSTYDTGSGPGTYYFTGPMFTGGTTITSNGGGVNGWYLATSASGWNGSTNAAHKGLTGTYTFFNPGGSDYKEWIGNTVYWRGFDAGTSGNVFAQGYVLTTAVNAFRIITSSGNLASGTVRCYGLAN